MKRKKLVLKKEVKEGIQKGLFYFVCIMGIIGCFKLLELQDQNEYKRAIKRCQNENNIQVKYSRQGDKYYTCINEQK